MAELTYRVIFFLLQFLLPIFSLVILVFIRYLFYDKRKYGPTSKVHFLFDIIEFLAFLAAVLSLTALSSWQYIRVGWVIMVSLIAFISLSIYYLKREYFRVSNPFKGYKEFDSIMLERRGSKGRRNSVEGESLMMGDSNSPTIMMNSSSSSLPSTPLKIDLSRFKILQKSWWMDEIHTLRLASKSASPKLWAFISFIIIMFGIIIPIMLDRMCICSHPMTLTTRISRIGKLSCSHSSICMVYLTMPQDPSTSIIFNVHTRDFPSNMYVHYVKGDNDNGNNVNGSSMAMQSTKSMSDIIWDEERYVSSAYLDSLESNQLYSFQICYDGSDGNSSICSHVYRFKTFTDDDTPISFVTGGDIQLNDEARGLAKQSASMKPNFVVVGGDIAYAEGIPGCYQRWDQKLQFLLSYFSYVGKDKIMLPFMFSIGNHEAGAFFQTSPSKAPFYLPYFPFSMNDVLVNANKRSSYHIHQLGNFGTIASLDSCVLASWDVQAPWLEEKYKTFNNSRNRVVVYHSPIYSGYAANQKIIKLGKEDILPVFEKYNVSFALENHEHLFKRSKPIRNEKVDETGTIYLGGGAWGIGSKSKNVDAPDLPWYLEKRSRANHLWIVTMTPSQSIAKAIDSDGDIIDQVTTDIQ